MKILFKNADILIRKEGKIDFLRNAFLATDGKIISYIGLSKPEGKFDQEKNMMGKLLIPGFYNTHAHTPMAMLRGLGSGKKLQDWLFNSIIPVEDKMVKADVKAGTQMSILEMISQGTVCYQDMYWRYQELLPDVLPSGIKVNAGAVIEWIGGNNEQQSLDFANRRLESTEDLAKNFQNAGDGLFIANLQMHSEYLMQDWIMEKAKDLLDKYGLSLHAHCSETKLEHEECIGRHGCTPIAYFNSYGLFKTGACLAHCVWASDQDLEILKHTGSSISHNPESNLKLGSGIAPISKALKMGVNVALGTDGVASNNNLNMFEEMHIASIIHNGASCDATAISPQQAFDMATYNGAKALHRENSGELAVGKDADIVAIDMDKIHLKPDNDTLALLVYSAQGSDVCLTMVNGQILYENGEFYTMDKEKIVAECMESTKRLMS